MISLRRHQLRYRPGGWDSSQLTIAQRFSPPATCCPFGDDPQRPLEALPVQTTPELGAIATATCPLRIQEWQMPVPTPFDEHGAIERFFRHHEMRPLFVEELAVHPDIQGRGLGSFMLEQVEHLARLRGCTDIVLEVAENNPTAMEFYKKRHFQKLDAAVFLAKKLATVPELLPARALKRGHRAKLGKAPASKARPPT